MKYDQQSNSYTLTKNELKELTKVFKLSRKLQDLFHELPYYQKDSDGDFDPIYDGLIRMNESINDFYTEYSKMVQECNLEKKYYKNCS